MKMVKLKCSNCKGDMEFNASNPIAFCPYCGEKLLIVESDEVKMQMNRSQTKKDMQKSQHEHEAEMEKLRYNLEKDKIKSETKDTLIVLLVGISLFLLIFVFGYFLSKIYPFSLFFLVQ